MLKKIFLLFLITFQYANAQNQQEEVTILIPKDSSQERTLLKKIKEKSIDRVNDFEADISFSFTNLRYSKFSAGVHVEQLSPIQTHHDNDKVYAEIDAKDRTPKKWNKVTLSTYIAFPLSFGIPELLGPIGFNIYVNNSYETKYSLVTKSDGMIREKGKLLDTLKDKWDHTLEGLKSLRIPLKAERIIDTYPSGTEIHIETIKQLIVSPSLSGNFGVFTAGVQLNALIKGLVHLKVEVKKILGKSFLRLKYQKKKHKGRGVAGGAHFGVTLFETKLPTKTSLTDDIRIRGDLKINILSMAKSTSNEDVLIYDYTYDMDNKLSMEAFNHAMRGNLIPTQKISVTRNEVAKYQGVITNFQKNDLISHTISQVHVGLMGNNSSLTSDSFLPKFQLSDKLGGLLRFSRYQSDSETSSQQSNFYHEAGDLKTFNYSKTAESKIFFGLINKTQNKVTVTTKILNSKMVSENQGIREFETYKINYHSQKKAKKWGTEEYKNFIRSSKSNLGLNDSSLMDLLSNIDKNKKCSKDLVINYQGAMYESAISRVLKYKDKEIWAQLGRFLRLRTPSLLRYEKKRETFLSQFKESTSLPGQVGTKEKKRIEKSYENLFLLEESDLSQKKWVISKIKKFKRLNFLNYIEQARKEKNKMKRAKHIHDLFKAYEVDDFIFHFFNLLAQGDPKGQDKSIYGGILTKYSLKSQKCQFNFALHRNPQYPIKEIMDDWNNYSIEN